MNRRLSTIVARARCVPIDRGQQYINAFLSLDRVLLLSNLVNGIKAVLILGIELQQWLIPKVVANLAFSAFLAPNVRVHLR